MKPLMMIFAFMSLTFLCEGQILKDSLYWATPAEREMYRSAIKKGRSQKALGTVAIFGGTTVMTFGAGVAIVGIKEAFDGDYDDPDYDTPGLLLKGGGILFAIGLASILTGADMIKEGTQKVRKGKVCFKLNATSVGLVVNF